MLRPAGAFVDYRTALFVARQPSFTAFPEQRTSRRLRLNGMKILMVHNFYQQRGGEDIEFHAEKALLESNGHQVPVYIRQNDEIKGYGPVEKASLPFRTVWAWDSSKQMRKLVDTEKPDVVHFHNTFPLVSPSAYSACR